MSTPETALQEIGKTKKAPRPPGPAPARAPGQTSAPARNRDSARLAPEEFRSPGAAPRIMPFWFWNTGITPALIDRQVSEMARAGVGGFFIHPRQGLAVPYLSPEWFALIRHAVAAAKRAGMHVWLYDEYPYPSGMAGGQLTADHPGFRAREIEYATAAAQGGRALARDFALARVVSAVACPIVRGKPQWNRALDVRGFFGGVLARQLFWRWKLPGCRYNDKRFMADGARLFFAWTPPGAGEWRVHFAFEREMRGFKYYDCYFDPLCPGAAQAFLRLTHARYAKETGGHFGKTIKGIFSDETEPSPWSPEIERELSRAHDIDLAMLMPALHDDSHPRASEIRYRFRQCALRLFQERWETPIANWCREHNLVWAAEKPTLRPSQFLAFGEPSTDAGHRRVGDAPEPLTWELRANARAAIAAAEQTGAGLVRCECFHNMGWGATLQDQKWQIDWLAAQGVNRITPHAFFASISGLRKHDAPPSFFTETPAWKHYRLLADYTARLCLALSRGADAARIAVLHPTESFWIGGAHASRAKEEYEWLMARLLAAHRSFHPVDAQALAAAQAGAGSLAAGRAYYRVLLVPPLATADAQTVAAVEKALAAGMPVLMAAPIADENVDGSSLRALFARDGIVPVRTRGEWMESLDQHLPRDFSVTLADGSEASDVWAAWREAGSQRILFLANTSREIRRVKVSVERNFAWSRWSLENGATAPCAQDSDDSLAFELAPLDSLLLVGERATTGPNGVPARKTRATFEMPLDGKWNLHPEAPNALRLNRWRVGGAAGGEIEVEALPLAHLDKHTEQWRRADVRSADGVVAYRRKIFCRHVPKDLELVIENGAIPGEWSLTINGRAIAAERFLADDSADAITCRVAAHFRAGENEITLRVADAMRTGGLCTPLHLRGSFTLAGDPAKPREIDRAPAGAGVRADFGALALAGAGYPHFSGTMLYRKKIKFPPLRAGDTIGLPCDFAAVAALSVAGRELGVCAWSPYRWTLACDIEGEVEVALRVTNTLLPYLEGQQWDYAAHAARDV